MYVSELWRYPVKSLRGERLTEASLSADGVEGDRLVHIRQRGNVVTGRTRHRLLGLNGTTGADGKPLINGLPWDGIEATGLVAQAAGPGAESVAYSGPERFDVLPLLVATDGGIQALGYDGRRLRPNIVVGGVPDLTERTWPGRALRIGDTVIGIMSLRARCIVTTIDPDTGAQDLNVLRRIHRQFGGALALNCWVERGGPIRIGDGVEVADEALEVPQAGGWITGAPYVTA
jgi:uncharacterized protein YcbX